MTVGVREPGQDHSGENLGIAGHGVRGDRCEPAAGDLEGHVPREA
jgi:hypothetical protein